MKTKALFITAISLLAWIQLSAQVEKNKLFVAGNFRIELNQGGENYKYQDGDNKYSYFDFDVQPKVGYTVIDRMPVGLFMDYDMYRLKVKDDNDKYLERSFVLGPFIRYYFADIVGLMPYGEALAGIGSYRTAYKTEGEDEWNFDIKEGYFTFRVGGGLTYFFNDWVGADLFLGFNHYAYTDRNDEEESDRSDDWDYKDVYNEFMMQVGIIVMFPLQK
jgi:hypothetical protein